MTQEEKAKKIVDSIFSTGFNTHRTFYEMAYNSAIRIAEWKDEHFAEEKKQWIEKVCKFLENRNVLEKDCSLLTSGICSITFHPDNLINDLKQAMEE